MDATQTLLRSALSGTFTAHLRALIEDPTPLQYFKSRRQPAWTTATNCKAFVFNFIVFLPLIRFQTMQIMINRVIDELVATHADVLPSSPALDEFFSSVVRPYLLSVTDITDGTMVFIRRGLPRLTRYL
jgi:hypothetical protein